MRVAIRLFVALISIAAAAQSKSSFFTTSDHVRIHYLDAGKGPSIVFIPGWTMPAEIWEQQIAYFSKSHRVVAIDPRSQGDSDKPQDGNYPERRAADYHELIQSLKLERPVLVGWSLAVPELMAYVDQFGASDVGGLVLVDGFVTIDDNLLKVFPTFLRTMQMDRRGFTERFVKAMYKKRQTEAYLQRVVTASLKTPTSNAVALQIGVLGHPDWSATLAKLANTPVLFIYEDNLKKQADALVEKLPSLKAELFAGSGHGLFVDDAERFNQTLARFISEAAGKQR